MTKQIQGGITHTCEQIGAAHNTGKQTEIDQYGIERYVADLVLFGKIDIDQIGGR